jgi:hypothetical protein
MAEIEETEERGDEGGFVAEQKAIYSLTGRFLNFGRDGVVLKVTTQHDSVNDSGLDFG